MKQGKAKKKIKIEQGLVPESVKPQPGSKYLMWIPFLFAFIIYGNSILNEFVLDDLPLITEQRFVQQGIDGIGDLLSNNYWVGSQQNLGYYRPLSQISFALEVEFFGNNPHLMHFTNVLLYALTGLFLFLFLNALFKGKSFFALIVSLLFLAHPIHTEVVANIKSRDEILAFLNSIIAFWMIWKFANRKKIQHLLLGCLFFFLALLSKETAMTGLFILPFVLWFFTEKSVKQVALLSLSFVVVSVLFLLLKYAMIGSLTGTPPTYLNVYPYREMSERIPSSIYIMGMYLYRTVFPFILLYDYSYNQIPAADWSNPVVIITIILILGIAHLKLKNLKRHNPIGFSIIYFGASLSVGIVFILMRGGIMAERFLYAPVLAFSIVLGHLLFKLLQDGISSDFKNFRIKKGILFVALTSTILVAFSVRTIIRNPDWKNNSTLFSADIGHGGNSSQLRKHYGSELINQSVSEKDQVRKDSLMQAGIKQLNKSLEINPDFSDAWFKLGFAYYQQGQYEKSIEYYEKANLKNAMTLSNLALSYYMINEYEKGYKMLTRSLELNPHNPTAQKNLPLLRNAWENSQKLPKSQPGQDAMYFYNKGNELAQQKDYRNALLHFKKAINLKPDFVEAMVNLGNCYYMLQDFLKAKESFEQAIRIRPGYSDAQGNLDRINKEIKARGL
ncbi:MAG: tetratricopeptide repeat protein [Bacteroidales bacterium]|nr:tetratricopeptide repeat protein [Bacteroidales bacterium]MCF8456891.1 tetratricopeptide repeat protein [Bacteroidales bacterium]